MKYIAIAFIAVVALPVAWRWYWKHPYIRGAKLDDSFEFMHEPDIDPDYQLLQWARDNEDNSVTLADVEAELENPSSGQLRTSMYEYIFGKQDGL